MLSLTWPPEPKRWSQQPAGLRRTSLCASLCIFASGLWSPWRREKREIEARRDTEGERRLALHGKLLHIIWVSITARECWALRQRMTRDNRSSACSNRIWKEDRGGGGSGGGGGGSLRFVDPCQWVTAGAVNVSQISPARSGGGETKYVRTLGIPPLSVSASASTLMRPVWVMVRTCQKWQRSHRARRAVKVKDRLLVCNFWPDRLWS